MTVEEYIKYRIGTINPLIVFRRIFTKPFMAKSLRKFWWYWNPGYGYFLLYYCYRPLRSIFPHSISLFITFFVCGFCHDILYLIPMALTDDGPLPVPFVTTWFLFISMGIMITEYFKVDFEKIKTSLRPLIHFSFLGITFALTVILS